MPMNFDRIKVTTASTGTGNIAVSSSAVARFRPLSDIPANTANVPLLIEDEAGTDWELSYCTILSATTFSRDTVIKGSNGTSKVNFGAGTKTVFMTVPAASLDKFASVDSAVVTSVASVNTTTVPLIESGTPKQITLANLLAAIGTSAANLPAAAAPSDSDIIAIMQDGANEAKITLAALRTYLGGPAAADTVAPTLSSAQVANATPTVIVLTFNETLAAFTPAASAFAVSGGKSVTAVSRSGATISLTVSAAYANGDAVSVTYTKPATNPLQDAAGNQVASFGPSGVSNNIAAAGDITAPTAASAAVANSTPTVVALTMSEPMDSAFVPAASAFTVTGHTVTSVAISSSTISLTVSAAFVNGEAARTVSYTQPGTNNARDVAGNLLASFGGLAITNNVAVAATAPGAPTISTAVAGDGYVDVAFTAPASNGGSAIIDYTATLSTGQSATGTTSPIRVTAPNGAAVTATVTARNAVGPSAASAASNSVTPTAAVAQVAYTITGYNGNAVKSPIDASAATAYGSLKQITPNMQGTNAAPNGIYWNVNATTGGAQAPSAVSGWGSSATVAPAEVTQAANQAGSSSVNGMTPMGKAAAFANNANLWVSTGFTGTMYFWIKPSDGAAQMVGSAVIQGA
jgi:hypothetical protein